MAKLTALIVDDDHNILSYFSFALEMGGYAVDTAADGRTARQKLADSQPDLIMLDMHLPDAFGADILREIRADARLQNVFVILATGEPQTVDPQTDELANFVLSKPVEHSQLLTLVDRISRARQ
jgi:two-component system OmpR family response regulator